MVGDDVRRLTPALPGNVILISQFHPEQIKTANYAKPNNQMSGQKD
jgi:hypothetical protein